MLTAGHGNYGHCRPSLNTHGPKRCSFLWMKSGLVSQAAAADSHSVVLKHANWDIFFLSGELLPLRQSGWFMVDVWSWRNICRNLSHREVTWWACTLSPEHPIHCSASVPVGFSLDLFEKLSLSLQMYVYLRSFLGKILICPWGDVPAAPVCQNNTEKSIYSATKLCKFSH